jgi:hypothetical protein
MMNGNIDGKRKKNWIEKKTFKRKKENSIKHKGHRKKNNQR